MLNMAPTDSLPAHGACVHTFRRPVHRDRWTRTPPMVPSSWELLGLAAHQIAAGFLCCPAVCGLGCHSFPLAALFLCGTRSLSES
jgi:hypothetical protein